MRRTRIQAPASEHHSRLAHSLNATNSVYIIQYTLRCFLRNLYIISTTLYDIFCVIMRNRGIDGQALINVLYVTPDSSARRPGVHAITKWRGFADARVYYFLGQIDDEMATDDIVSEKMYGQGFRSSTAI